MKNVLVTGGAGFIGSFFVAQEVKLGNNVVVLDALTYASKEEYLKYIDKQNWKGKYRLVVGNICNYDLVLRLLKENDIEWVVHFAAETHVDRSIQDSTIFIETNVLGTQRMLRASLDYYEGLDKNRKRKFKFHHISTDEVFGDLELHSSKKFNEETKPRPNNPYAATKAASEHLVRIWNHTYGLPITTSNCTNNYGPRQYYEKLIPLMIKFALEGKSMTIHGNGKNVRDWVHVDDHNHGIHLILEKGKIGETYCLGGNAERSNEYVVHKIAEILDELKPKKDKKSYKQQIVYVKDRPGNDLRYAIDSSKIENELGFKRKYENFEEGLKETVAWYLDNLDFFD